MPNRLKLLRRKGPRIFDKIAKSRGPIALVDESFLAPSQGPNGFYILSAVVVEKSEIRFLRSKLSSLAASKTFHSTEAARSDTGRQLIRNLADAIADLSTTLIAVQRELDSADSAAEQARVKLFQALLEELAESQLGPGGTVIYEKRALGEMRNRDEALFRSIREGGGVGADLKIWGTEAKSEPLLWAADVTAWCFRQAHLEKDLSYFERLEKRAVILSF